MGIDTREVSTSLPDGFANAFRFASDLDQQARLSLEAIQMCNDSTEDLQNVLAVIRFIAEIYKHSEEDTPLVTDTDMKLLLHMADDVIARVCSILAGEGNLFQSSSMSQDGSGPWRFGLDRAIRQFDGVTSIDDYLERKWKENISVRQQATQQLTSFLGYMYRTPGSDDAVAGMTTWVKNLTEPNEETGVKLEVALLNALARLGVAVLFGGDVSRIDPNSGSKKQSGPATPVFDLVAVNFGAHVLQSPTAVLISYKSTNKQPNRTDIALLSDESRKVHTLLPNWVVFGVLVNLGEPTADEFTYRQDVRIWKQSDVQALLHAKDYQSIAQFL